MLQQLIAVFLGMSAWSVSVEWRSSICPSKLNKISFLH